jgi:hypothetical protein
MTENKQPEADKTIKSDELTRPELLNAIDSVRDSKQNPADKIGS